MIPPTCQVYCLDFGGGALSSLRSLPHIGAVAGRLDAGLVRRTIAQLDRCCGRGRNRFRTLGVDSVANTASGRAAGDAADVADDRFGDVFLVIDGWAAVRQDFDSLEAPITALAAQGLSYGVHVVVAASRWAEIRPALKDQIGTRVELRLGDPAESEMDRKQARQLSAQPAGPGHHPRRARDGNRTAPIGRQGDEHSARRIDRRERRIAARPIRRA